MGQINGYQVELKVKINRARIHTIINKATKHNKEIGKMRRSKQRGLLLFCLFKTERWKLI